MNALSDPKLTDERLRSWLNGDQPSRERLCRAVMALDAQYRRVEPRRPEGGPDGSRDIEAVDTNMRPVWGAVGFRNSVVDSAEDRRAIAKKFREDLDAAVRKNEHLKAFVFFTNVDLRPSETSSLQGYANSKGITHVDIYWRERIARALDSVEGLGIRFQYLRIPLSEPEQVSFFGRFGNQIESLITQHHERLEVRLDGLEFGIATTWPFKSIELAICLADGASQERMIGEKVLIEISLPNNDILFMLADCGSDENSNRLRTYGRCWLWSNTEKTIGSGQSSADLHRSQYHIACSLSLNDRSGVPVTFGSLEGCPLSIYLTKSLAECSIEFELLLNDFVAHKALVETSFAPPAYRPWWNKGLPEEVKALDWYAILLVGGATWHRRIALRRKHLRVAGTDDESVQLNGSFLLGSHEYVDSSRAQDRPENLASPGSEKRGLPLTIAAIRSSRRGSDIIRQMQIEACNTIGLEQLPQ